MLTFSSGLAAGLAAVNNRLDWCNLIISTLGATRAVEFKSAVSGNPFPSGTTFYAAPVTGTMTVSSGKVADLGKVGAQTVRASADLLTRVAALRFTGGGEYVQGTVGLTAETIGYDGQPVDFVLRRNPNGTYGYTLNGAKITAPLHLAAAPDVELGQVRMLATGGVDEAAGFVSPFFGCLFAQGAIPAGTYPYFRVVGGGAGCPATLWGATYWPDGSMAFCGAMVRVPVAVPASSYVDISMRSGGDVPVAGARTTGDLTAADINVQMVGVDGLTGTWTATLNDAVATGAAIEKIGDGPAGAIWRIGGEVRDGSSAAHGQMYCWHYVAALTNANGTLRGLRYMGRVAQPWVDVATPAPRHRDLQAALRRGSTVIRTMQGHTDTETAGSTIRLPHYGSFMTAGADGKWDYVQGGGSTAADAAVRVIVSAAYLKVTKMIPPFDLVQAPTSYASADYVPMGRGTYVARLMGTTGGRPDIGLWTNWCVTHLADQSALNERLVRVNALLGASWRIANRRQTTRMPALLSNMPNTYEGLGATNTTNPAAASPNLSLWAEDGAHFPNPFSWAYAFTGEPQYLDLMQDRAANVQAVTKGKRTMKTTWPITSTQYQAFVGAADIELGTSGPIYPAAGLLFVPGGIRQAAWALRDIAHAAAFSPAGPYKQYLTDIIASCVAAFKAYVTLAPQSYREAGFFITQTDGANANFYESPWMTGFLNTVLNVISDILPSDDAVYMRQHLARFWVSHAAVMDPGMTSAYRHSPWDGDGLMASTAAESLFTSGSATLTFTAADSRGTLANCNWNPTNGDIFAFAVGSFSTAYPFPSATYNKRFYAVNCSGKTLQLAATPGGAPITVPTDVDCGLFLVRAANLPPDVFIHSVDYHEYFQIVSGVIGYNAAQSEPGSAALLSTLRARATAKSWPYSADRFTFAGSRA